MRLRLLIIGIVLVILAGCGASSSSGNPPWVDELIKDFEKAPVGNPPLSIWRYEYNGQEVYFVPAHCCDIPGVVYDAGGNALCEPDGGLDGQGDGRCRDFFSERVDEQLVWQDSRTH